MLMHKIPPPCLGLVKYMSSNHLDSIPISLACSSPSPCPEHHLSRPIDYHVMCNLSLDLGYIDHLFDMNKGNVLYVIWSLGVFGGYNPFHDTFIYT